MTKEIEFDSDQMSDKDQERFGFYLFMLENICGIKDMPDLLNLITDTDFNNTIYRSKFDDQGIDAIFIDEENSTINLFNFKFREKFNRDKTQSVNETILSSKFISALMTNNIEHLENKIHDYAKIILEHFNSKKEWNFKLYIISNETKEINKNHVNLKQLEESYGLEIVPFGLPKIIEMTSIKPDPVNASFVMNRDAIMSYTENDMSSSKSYIVRLTNSELIRITCDDRDLRDMYDIENIDRLSDKKLDFSVLFDNVRGFIQKSKFNKNIMKSLKDEPEKFFMYNNGITIISESIKSQEFNAKTKIKLELKNFQVLNGGQTLRTIHNFNQADANNLTEYLSRGEVLVRIFTTSDDSINKIAEYTNSQNSISNVDLKSLSSEQILLEQYLDEHNIIYARKRGDIGLDDTKEYIHKISMEKFGQILFSIRGNPHKATSQKKQIFDKYYKDIFSEKELDIEKSPTYIKNYFKIIASYKKLGIKYSDNKAFYILYLIEKISTKSIDELINKLEEFLSKFKTHEELADTRKLLQLKFKEELDKSLNIIS